MLKFLFPAILILLLTVSILARDKPVDRKIVRFPTLGKVEITTWENDQDFPRIIFRNAETGKLIREIAYFDNEDPEWWRIDIKRDFHQTIHFRILDVPQIASPVVFVTGVNRGGSDGTLQTYLVTEDKGKLKVINTVPLISSYQGGTYVGDLGKKYGFGAVTWNFEWDEGTAHYANHPFGIDIYSFDQKDKQFVFKKTLMTKKTYYYGNNPAAPLRELGILGNDLLETLPGLENRREW